MKRPALFLLAGLLVLAGMAQGDPVAVRYQGAGWIQAGRIQQSSDTVTDGSRNNVNNNWMQNAGGQITALVDMGGGWEGGLGLGAIQTHIARGSLIADQNWGTFWAPYVTEARATYTVGEKERPVFQMTVGSFPYNYNSDVKNLGLYLLRGMVYPGTVISGFETKHVLPIASIYGANIRNEIGGFRQDVIINSETDVSPYFDFSLAYLFRHRLGAAFEYGAGANWYRALPQSDNLTSPGKDCANPSSSYELNSGDEEVCYSLDTVSVDGSGNAVVDTVEGSLSGIKLMGRMAFDPKAFFEGASFGPEDLKLYAEIALLGVENRGKYYDKPMQRMPVMVGFNLPAFGYLDVVSLEVEYYGTRNHSDYMKVMRDNSWVPRPVEKFKNDFNPHRDNWKWSLYASKVIASHVKLSAQVANDHLRPGGQALQETQSEAFTTPKDWYWMTKMAFFF